MLTIAISSLAASAVDGDVSGLPSLAGAVWKMILALGIIIALLLGSAAAVRRLRRGARIGVDAAAMRIVERLHLDSKRQLFLIEVRGEPIVVGVAGEAIALLARLQTAGPEAVAAPIRTTSVADGPEPAARLRTPAAILQDAVRSLVGAGATTGGGR